MLGRVQSSPDNHSDYNEEMSVLERQRAIFQRLYESQQQISSLSYQNLAQCNSLISEQIVNGAQFQNFPVKIDPQMDQNSSFLNMFDREQRNWSSSDFTNNNSLELARQSFSTVSNSSITTTSRPLLKENVVSTKKRKAEFVEEGNCKTKKHEGEAGEVKSEIIVENDKVTSTNNLKENSTNSEVKKPDYIHVRARRGQATDSHSLAERARREKIGKKMKCLQDLVPGCNKVIGKAGMLDEIINYVQSLQKQVEFLSMKLAASNNTDSNLFATYMANFPTMAAPSTLEIANIPAFLQNNLIQQQQGSSMGRENCSMSFPEAFIDTSHVQAGQQLPSFETDLQCLFGVRFQ